MDMKTKLTDDKAFYVKNGPVIKSVKELAEALDSDSISDEAFQFHLNNNNNDFINWIDGVYKASDLVKSLKRVKTKKGFAKKLHEAVK